MSRFGSKRSIAPIRPRRPYETRSFSSTCAGRPLPRRPATYLTSGAYVRMSRSRTPWSLLLAYSRQSACVSSAAIGREYGLVRFSPQVPQREGEQPERDRSGRQDEHHQAVVAVDGFGCGGGDPSERDCQNEKERPERGPWRGRSHTKTLEGARLQSLAQPLGA